MLLRFRLALSLLCRGGGKYMVDIYVGLIVKKRRTIDQVPVALRTAVLADLNALGFDGYGNMIEE